MSDQPYNLCWQAEIRELQAANRSLLRRVYAEVPEARPGPLATGKSQKSFLRGDTKVM